MSDNTANPFDNEDYTFTVLRNMYGQHSLWPQFRPSPEGWDVVYGPSSHEDCLAWVSSVWPDITPQNPAARGG